jgi:hypothetical protein
MTDTVHIDGNSPEAVAYKLLHHIAVVEGRVFARFPENGCTPVDRKWILETYFECLRVMRETKAPAGGWRFSRG